MRQQGVVIGLDGGGTTTRALCCDLSGNVLGYAEAGGSSVQHNPEEDARAHVQAAIADALQQAGCKATEVRALAAGLAGLDRPEDHEWAERLTGMADFGGLCLHVNDSVVAHAGALLSQPGIIVIAGTGAITFGINEAGRELRNYDFNHYADTGARSLTLRCLHRLLAGEAEAGDSDFARAVLDFWNVADKDALWQTVSQWGAQPWADKVHHWGRMAPLVTRLAQEGAPLPQRVCRDAAEQISISVRLLGAGFASRPISVALIGGAARSPYMQQAIAEYLEQRAPNTYHLTTPLLCSAAGAVLLALKQIGIVPDETLIRRLRAHPRAAFSE